MRAFSYILLTTSCFLHVVFTAPTATADNGVFVGIATAVPGGTQTVNKWLGIPFAVTPPQRFSPPVQAANSNAVRQATNYGPGCLQQGSGKTISVLQYPTSSESVL
jgi:carboxylesterase type B